MTTVVAITIQSLMVRPSPASSAATLTLPRSAAYWTLVQRVPPESKPTSRRRGRRLDVGLKCWTRGEWARRMIKSAFPRVSTHMQLSVRAVPPHVAPSDVRSFPRSPSRGAGRAMTPAPEARRWPIREPSPRAFGRYPMATEARNNAGGGATFSFTLPVDGAGP
jgi:hypothetical protein